MKIDWKMVGLRLWFIRIWDCGNGTIDHMEWDYHINDFVAVQGNKITRAEYAQKHNINDTTLESYERGERKDKRTKKVVDSIPSIEYLLDMSFRFPRITINDILLGNDRLDSRISDYVYSTNCDHRFRKRFAELFDKDIQDIIDDSSDEFSPDDYTDEDYPFDYDSSEWDI